MPKVTGSGYTSQNMFQRAQELLRQKLYGTSKVTGSPSVSSTNQTTIDAKSGGKALRAYEQTRSSKPKLPGLRNPLQGLKLPTSAAAVGVLGATKLAESAGRPGQSRMSMFGTYFKGDAPVYSTPLNSSTPKFADLRGSDKPGSGTSAKTNAGEGEAMDAADKFRPGAGYPAGVVRPMDYKTKPGQLQTDLDPRSNGSSDSDGRVNSEGLVQYGQTLGGLNTFNKGFLGDGYDLTDIESTYQSVALPATLAGVTQLEKPLVEGANPTQKPDVSQPFQQDPQPQGSFPEGTKPFASTDKYTPYSTGGNPQDPQDGSSSEPDRVERIRQLAFEPKGARQKEVASRKAVRGNFGGDEPDDSTLVSPMYANKERNKIRDTFLNYEGSSVKAAVAANAVAGFGKDQNGNARFNVGGELVNAKEGMEWKAKNAAMKGLDPSEFLQTKIAKVKEETNK